MCKRSRTKAGNAILPCGRCAKGFHQQCHSPAAQLGQHEDKWFCGRCTLLMAQERRLRLRPGDFAWASLKAGSQAWPAVVLEVTFAAGDARPYEVKLFGCRMDGQTRARLGPGEVVAWTAGPDMACLSGARLQAAKLANLAGAGEVAAPQTPAEVSRGTNGTRRRKPSPEWVPMSAVDEGSVGGSTPKRRRKDSSPQTPAASAPSKQKEMKEPMSEVQEALKAFGEAQVMMAKALASIVDSASQGTAQQASRIRR